MNLRNYDWYKEKTQRKLLKKLKDDDWKKKTQASFGKA